MAREASPRKIGLIVNPIAGMGGRVALKGTDGAAILAEARQRGAEPSAEARAIRALGKLAAAGVPVDLHACAGIMGADAATAVGLTPRLLARGIGPETTADDTKAAAEALEELRVDLILFAGGDGTARDIVSVVGNRVPILGIPGGVKMNSAVFAVSPEAAGQLAALIAGDDESRIAWREGEVMDVDEAAIRAGRLSAQLFGFARVLVERNLVQGPKTASLTDDAALEGLTAQIAQTMTPGTLYLLGPGGSTRRILQHLGLEGTLLGVDAVKDGRLVGRDLATRDLARLATGPAKIVVSVVGGQGYLFGRGNQQFDPALIRHIGRDNIVVIATQAKLLALANNHLLVDTGDADLDRALAGFIRVQIGPSRSTLMRIA